MLIKVGCKVFNSLTKAHFFGLLQNSSITPIQDLPLSHCKKRGVVLHPIRCSTASVSSTLSLKLNFFCIVQG